MFIQNFPRFGTLILILSLPFVLFSCGGSSDTSDSDSKKKASYSLRCEVAGLDGTLVLSTSKGDTAEVTEDGMVTFETKVEDGDSFSITISDSPMDQDCAISQGEGKIEGKNVVAQCVCENQPWDHPAFSSSFISLSDGNGNSARAAFGGNGIAAIVWKQDSDTESVILRSFFKDGVWTHPTSMDDKINSEGSQGTSNLDIAFNSNGEGILAWGETTASDGTMVYFSEYRSGTWSTPTRISPLGANTSLIKVAISDNGDSVVAWMQSDGVATSLFKSEYRGGTWTHPASLANNVSPNGQPVEKFDLAMDASGNSILAWIQDDGSTGCYGGSAECERLYMIEYRGSSWTTVTNLLADSISFPGQFISSLSVAMDDHANAIIAFTERYPEANLYISEYRSGAWTHPADFDDFAVESAVNGGNPKSAMSNNGEAAVTFWKNSVGVRHVFLTTFREGTWSHASVEGPTQLSPSDGDNAIYMDIGMDNAGNIILPWDQSSTSSDWDALLFAEYRDGSWLTPSSLNAKINPEGSIDQSPGPQVAVAKDGNALIVWSQMQEGYTRLFFSQYTPPIP